MVHSNKFKHYIIKTLSNFIAFYLNISKTAFEVVIIHFSNCKFIFNTNDYLKSKYITQDQNKLAFSFKEV